MIELRLKISKSCLLPSDKRGSPSSSTRRLYQNYNSFYLVVLEGPVDLLDVGEDNFGVKPSRTDHLVHVVPGDEVGDTR